MARKRYVTSDIAIDERLAEIAAEDPQSALMWPWFLLLFDDWGRAEMNAMKIRLQLFPAFPFLVADIERAVAAFSSEGLVSFYEVGGVRYGAIRPRTWLKYQVYLKGTKRATTESSIPAPPDNLWNEADETALADMLKPNDYKKKGLSADKSDCPQTIPIVCGQSGLSVPSPSPSLSPSLPQSKTQVKISRPSEVEKTGPEERNKDTDQGFFLSAEEFPRPLTGAELRKRWEAGTKDFFDRVFWARYPRKDKKADALKAFRQVFPYGQGSDEKLRRSRNLQDYLVKALADFSEREDARFIPLPASWLRAQDFDESPAEDQVPSQGPMFVPCESGTDDVP